MTKTITAALLLRLEQEGIVVGQQPLAQLLPVPPKPLITLTQLVEHTSGLPRLPPGTRRFSGADPYARIDEESFERSVRKLPELLVSAPGLRVNYSNFGYAVLGAALAASVGQAWAVAADKFVIQPLGLCDMLFTDPAWVDSQRRVVATNSAGGERRAWRLGPVAPAGGAWGTVAGLGKYVRLVVLERAFDRLPKGWQLSHQLLWHNGATRDATVFVGADPVSGRWAVTHGLRAGLQRTDAMAMSMLSEDGGLT